MFKRIFPILLTLLVILSIEGCVKSSTPDTASKPETQAPRSESGNNDMIASPLPKGGDSGNGEITKETNDKSMIADLVDEKIFQRLSSPDLGGREMGSPESLKAQNMIVGLFKAMGLLPFHEDYSYSVFMNEFESTAASVVLNDGSARRSLMAGDEYFVAPGKAWSGEYRVVFKAPVNDGEKVIYIADDRNNSTAIKENAIGYIYPRSPLFRSVEKGPASKLYLFINTEIIDQLKQSDGQATLTVDIPEAQSVKTVEGSNIIGYLPGKNHNESLIITAHYDGEDSETAALDNASGTYAMLNIAEKLSALSKDHELEMDLIFAAFDGEEKGLVGSAFLADEIKRRCGNYTVINLDCVGIKGSDSYMVIGDRMRSPKLIDSLYQQLEASKLTTVPVTGFFGSDHIPFLWQGFNAVTIGERDVEGIVHTENDTVTAVDTAEIDRLSEAIIDYILK